MLPPNPDVPIALLEDDSGDVLFVHRALQEAGIENPLMVFRSVEQARAFVVYAATQPASLQPALFIVDIMLSGPETGIDFLRWLRDQSAPIGGTPTMMVSASVERKDHDLAAQLGATYFLHKPVSAEALTDAVQSLGYVLITRRHNQVRRYIERPANSSRR